MEQEATMTQERFREHFSTGADAFVVLPADGSAPRRPDGLPLTDRDREVLRENGK